MGGDGLRQAAEPVGGPGAGRLGRRRVDQHRTVLRRDPHPPEQVLRIFALGRPQAERRGTRRRRRSERGGQVEESGRPMPSGVGCHPMRQQQLAPVRRMPDAHRNPGRARGQRTLERRREQHRGLQPLAPQRFHGLLPRAQAAAAGRRGGRHDVVERRDAAGELHVRGPRHGHDARRRQVRAKRVNGRQRHHDVAHPVRQADQQALDRGRDAGAVHTGILPAAARPAGLGVP